MVSNTSTIQDIKESYMEVIRTAFGDSKVGIYESDAFINPRIRLPAISVQRGERIKADMRDATAGHRTYNLPFRTTIYTEPMSKREIHPELYYFEEKLCDAVHTAELNHDLSDHVQRVEFISAREGTIYDLSTERVFANTVVVMFNMIYEVLIPNSPVP